jgi:hypothetical protein
VGVGYFNCLELPAAVPPTEVASTPLSVTLPLLFIEDTASALKSPEYE